MYATAFKIEVKSSVSENVGHYCGLFGVYGRPDAVELTYLALYSQQHRGEEAAGICSADDNQIVRYTGSGLVTDVFDTRKLEQTPQPPRHRPRPL